MGTVVAAIPCGVVFAISTSVGVSWDIMDFVWDGGEEFMW
jgi:hypothetical protein